MRVDCALDLGRSHVGNHRRRWLAVAGTAMVLLVVFAPDALAGEDPPLKGDATVTYTPVAGQPCSSRPDADAVAMRPKSWINIVNHTGFAAVLQTGTGRTVDFPTAAPLVDGKSLRLPAGHYVLQLVPTCPGVGDLLATIVDVADTAPDPPQVTPGGGIPVAGPPTQEPPSDNPPSGNPPSDDPGAGPGAGPGVLVGGTTGPETNPYANQPVGGPATSSNPAGNSGQGGGQAIQPGTGQQYGDDLTGAIEVRPYSTPQSLSAAESARRNRLLAIIAAICVLGVTTAIIRAIISERVTRTSGR